jgi:hypothetical protein
MSAAGRPVSALGISVHEEVRGLILLTTPRIPSFCRRLRLSALVDAAVHSAPRIAV